MIKYHLYFLAGLLLMTVALSSCTQKNFKNEKRAFMPFGISYGKISAEDLDTYKLLILEPGHYKKKEITTLKEQTGAKIISYLSVGEVNPNRWYFETLKERGFLGKNENWGSYYINLQDSVTKELFRKEIIPEIMAKGFDGIFLDTVDGVASYTGRAYLQPHMVSLIKSIRDQHPQSTIIQNAGLFLLDKTATLVDAVLIEDIASGYDFDKNEYYLTALDEYQRKAAMLDSLSNQYSKPFLIVDFADTPSLRTELIARLDTLSFPYFISTIELNSISESTSRRH